jgi:hypothetical protein
VLTVPEVSLAVASESKMNTNECVHKFLRAKSNNRDQCNGWSNKPQKKLRQDNFRRSTFNKVYFVIKCDKFKCRQVS